MKKFDFAGWVTRNNVKCSDGRTIMQDAFKADDGKIVPLVWNHQHNDPENIIGQVQLENRPEGVYGYATFNNGLKSASAKEAVRHKDIVAMSIYANQLQQSAANVLHGVIREVSLVLAGANKEALIDNVIYHSEYGDVESDAEAIIYPGLEFEDAELVHGEESEHVDEADELEHADEKNDAEDENDEENKEETIADVFATMTEKQQNAALAMIAQALAMGDEEENKKEKAEEGKEEENDMKHNVFDKETGRQGNVLSHSDMEEIISRAKKLGSLKDATEEFMENNAIQHDDETAQTYGVQNVDYLFPEYKTLQAQPEFIGRNQGWVTKFMNGVHRTPFSRIKSVFANITEDEARARGYIKGKMKKEEVFSLLKRTTDPQTIYKKQKLDRDDVVDITDFDTVAWIKQEMRVMLDEEIARASLIGDGRLTSDDDHISEEHIRPIAKEADLYAVKVKIKGTDVKDMINEIVRARRLYKGSGSPTFWTTEEMLTEMLLLEDTMGHPLYADEAALARKLRVKEIVTVPVMEGVQINNKPLVGIIVNLADYNIGADRGGEINLFDDFDIDYNQMKYLMETRCSGALVKPYSALVFTNGEESTSHSSTNPSDAA